jgi:Peptidase family C25/Propeptide_C25
MRKGCELYIVIVLIMSLFPLNISHGITMEKQHANIEGSISTSITLPSQPTYTEKEGFIQVNMAGATTSLSERNKPVLPIVVKTFEIPFCSENITVECIPQIISSMDLEGQIVPACITSFSKVSDALSYIKDTSVYESSAFYPSVWFTYDLGAGRNDAGQEVTFVKVICYPVQYSPQGYELRYTHGFDITVRYIPPMKQAKILSTYDMVIIAPPAFQTTLQPLIDHKNAKGVKTIFKSVEDILNEYTGYDQPEQVKLFIKDAYDLWGIQYVLLVGGLKSYINAYDKDTSSAGYSAWWVPVRYANIIFSDEGLYLPSVISDLYYGCLYNATGGFDSWDSNHDGIYAAMGDPGVANDTFDLYPEVSVGRLPVTTTKELTIVVNKIITYESSGPEEKPWYNTFVSVAGKAFIDFQGKPDGEYLADLAYNETKNAIPDLHHVQVYASNRGTGGLVPVPRDIVKAISDGAGFVDFVGHGSSTDWDCIWADKNGSNLSDWTRAFGIHQFPQLSNGEALPVVISLGCWNGLFNISILRDYSRWSIFAHFCFCWGLVLKNHGGAIASIGDTCAGLGVDVGNPVGLSTELDNNFYCEIGRGLPILGQIHSGAVQKFLSEEHIGLWEAYCISIWQLFGDPSLRLGGYPS